MRSLLVATWLRLRNLLKFPAPSQASLREKAIVIARRVTIAKNRECSQASCPVCMNIISAKGDTDLRMALALHLSLWHPDDVILQWDFMQGKNQVLVHLPSVIIGVGIAAGFGALLAMSARKQIGHLPRKLNR